MDHGKEQTYLSVEEFARRSGFGESTIWRYLRKGKLPKYQPGGARCRVAIPEDALQKAIAWSASSPSAATINSVSTETPQPASGTQMKKRSGRRAKWKK
jgi:excisionase family DNA binding protein